MFPLNLNTQLLKTNALRITLKVSTETRDQLDSWESAHSVLSPYPVLCHMYLTDFNLGVN